MPIKRFWIEARWPDRKAIGRACEWMVRALTPGSVGLVAVPTKAALTGAFSDEQPTLARTLEREGQMTAGGATIALLTQRTGFELEPNGPALVLQANMDLLNMVEATGGVHEVLAVPWNKADIDLWVRTWAARKI